MGRIKGQDRDALELTMGVLLWITCAKRQLTTSELQHALAVEQGAPKLDKENIPQVEDMASVCAGLVVVDEKSNIIHLVHYTTQDYFEARKKYWFPDAESNFTMICITYLSFNTFESGPCLTNEEFEARIQQNPLYDYAAQNWGHHARAAVTKLDQLSLDLLESDAKVSASSQTLVVSKHYLGHNYYEAKQITALHLTAYFGLNEATSTLLRHGRRPDLKDSYGRTPLSWAAENGHDGVVKLLLETGKVNADSKDVTFGRTPLIWAAGNGHDGIVKLLIDTGKVDADSKDEFPGQCDGLVTLAGYHVRCSCLLCCFVDKYGVTSFLPSSC